MMIRRIILIHTMLRYTKQLQPLVRRTLPSQSIRTMTGTAGTDKTQKDFSDSAPGGMSTSNNPDEIPADAKALEPDAGEEAKTKEDAGMDTLPTIT